MAFRQPLGINGYKTYINVAEMPDVLQGIISDITENCIK